MDPTPARKLPSQDRSHVTFQAILEATVEVLLAGGPERLTTTRVAERAGVSVGSLYQYFPNKQALLAAVLEAHLARVTDAVEAACVAARGRPLAEMAARVTAVYLDAKLKDARAAAALYAIAEQAGGPQAVERLKVRAGAALAGMLATSGRIAPGDVAIVAGIATQAMGGPVTDYLRRGADPSERARLEAELARLAGAYFEASAIGSCGQWVASIA